MARVFSEGFEGGDLLPYVVSGASNSSSNARSGSRCLLLNSNSQYIQKILSSNLSEFYHRVAIRPPSTISAASDVNVFLNSTTIIGHLQCNTDGSLTYYIGSGTGTVAFTTAALVMAGATYALVEIYLKISDSVGVVTCKVDGIQRGTFSGDTKPGSDTNIDRVQLGAANGVYNYDDWGLNDTTGGADNSYCGDGHIISLTPNAAGDASDFSVSGAANDYSATDEIPPNNDTDYIYTSATGQRDAMNLSASGLSGVSISRVWVEMVSKIDVADGSTLGMYIRTGSTNYDDSGGLLAQTLSYVRYRSQEWLTNPNTTIAWTVTDVDGLQAGVRT